MKQHWHIACILIGILLMAASAAWPHMVDSRKQWTNEKAAQFEEVNARLHELSDVRGHGHQHDGLTHERASEQLAEAERDFDELAPELDAARTGPRKTAAWLQWIGIAVAALGIVAYWAGEQDT